MTTKPSRGFQARPHPSSRPRRISGIASETIDGVAPRSKAYEGLRQPERTRTPRAVTNKRKAAVDGGRCKADSVTMLIGWTTVRMRALRGNPEGLPVRLGDLLRDLANALLDPYSPELAYMRGPG